MKNMNHLLPLTRLKAEYALLWALPLLLAALYESDVLPRGIYADHPQTEYLLQTAGILLAIVLIPLSLRLFQLSLTRHVRQLPLTEALRSYRRWSEVRLCLLLTAALSNLTVYYWTLSTTGLLCAGMVMAATLFCVPGQKRMEDELSLPTLTDKEASAS